MKSNFVILGLIAAFLLCVAPLNARTYLVSVGINDYSTFDSIISNLLLPVNDANAIADMYSHNSSVDYTLLIDGKATRKRILRAMSKVYKKAGPDDCIVFFFSGHGYMRGICAADTLITYEDIKAKLSVVRCNTKLLLIDACRSGGFRENISSKKHEETHTNTVLFLASRNNENSIERKDMKNGFFTTYLVKGLRGNADTNRDRRITAKELYDFVSQRVAIQSGDRQHPVMYGNFNDTTAIIEW